MIELVIILVSFILTFYFSGTETAFISVNRVRIEIWRRQQRRVSALITKFLREPERFIYTTLVGNNIANVAFASYATIYFNDFIDPKLTWLIITGLTILWGEIIPKTLFRSLADFIVPKIAPILEFFHFLFYPMIWIVKHISGWILRLFHHEEKEIEEFFSKRDVEILIRESQEKVKIDPVESQIFSRLLTLRKMKVKDAMIPRTEIVAVSENTSLSELNRVFQKSGLTRIPVFRTNLDDIVGIVFMKDLFTNPNNIHELIRDAMVVPETKRGSYLLQEFREKNTTIALVVNEYGGTAGLVTAEDLVEKLVGEIEDEFDVTPTQIRKVDTNTYSISGRIKLDQFIQELGVKLPEGSYDTLAGFVLNYLGHIPRKDEAFEYEGIKFIITRATRRKVERIRLILPIE